MIWIAGFLLACFIAIVVNRWMESRCHVCLTRKARWEHGDVPICRECWADVQAAERMIDAITARTADKEIEDYIRRHPKP